MTLVEALSCLHKSGLIRGSWLPGMRVMSGSQNGRIVLSNTMGIQYIEWERCHDRHTWGLADIPQFWALDVDDAATVGALLVLLRKAANEPALYARVTPGRAWWTILSVDATWNGFKVLEQTEGEAIAAGLIALAKSAGN